ncbi:MAG: translesion error-prone DNA polymerase V autoproteolytic subunit [Planctomycetota bacterium]
MTSPIIPILGPPLPLPLMSANVPAGFPSPAEDYVQGQLDLNDHLITRPAATYYVRATGDSMIGAGIHAGDLLIVDKAEEAVSGRVVIAAIDGELTVKRIERRGRRVLLKAENPLYPPIIFEDDDAAELVVWGVVTAVIHRP